MVITIIGWLPAGGHGLRSVDCDAAAAKCKLAAAGNDLPCDQQASSSSAEFSLRVSHTHIRSYVLVHKVPFRTEAAYLSLYSKPPPTNCVPAPDALSLIS